MRETDAEDWLTSNVIVGAQNGAQKWNPKQGPKYDPNQDPKMQSGAPDLYWDANKVYMIFI